MTALAGDLRWVLDALPMAVWVGNVPDGKVAYVNRAFEDIMETLPAETGRAPHAADVYNVFCNDREPYPAEKLPFARVLATQRPATVDDIVVRRPGADMCLRAVGTPVFGVDGTMTYIMVVFFDITAEKAAERERALAEERLTFVCNHAPVSIWATDAQGNITLSEGAALASLGVRPGQLVGQNVFALYADHPTVPAYMRRALAGESVWYTAADGPAIFESWLSPFFDHTGNLVGLAGFSNDVSEIRRLQSTVIQNDRVSAMGTLAASVAHEINNPLTYVLAHGDALAAELDVLDGLLAERGGGEEPAVRACLARMREELSPIRSGTSQIATITRDLRTFSRVDDATLEPVSVRAVIDAVLKLVRKEVEANARLVLDLRDTPPVMGNETRLVQVVLNLIVNALHALPQTSAGRREVGVRTYVSEDSVVIEVSDSGPGVPAADRERIFDPFFSTKEIGSGTGLGLFVCRNIARGLSGDVTVGDAPDGGALFRVMLPATEATTAPAQDREVSSAPSAGQHVMVIDDDELVLWALSAQLEDAGFRVTAVGDALSALAVLRDSADVDLVYCDLMMTGMTGMEFAGALADEMPLVVPKVVFMTGGAFTPKAQAFVAKHHERTVDKPFGIVDETLRRLSRR